MLLACVDIGHECCVVGCWVFTLISNINVFTFTLISDMNGASAR